MCGKVIQRLTFQEFDRSIISASDDSCQFGCDSYSKSRFWLNEFSVKALIPTMAGRTPMANHIVGNLLNREINGKALHIVNGPIEYDLQNIGCYNGPFGKSPPDRLRMSIDSVIPKYALEAGNIFMGFTQCGRYLLSYTTRPNDAGLWNRIGDLSFSYKLHFWLFIPYKQTREVCNVNLFENQTIPHDNLLIEIAQWPCDSRRLLVTGRSLNPTNPCSNDSLIYVTFTTVPPAEPCAICKYEPPDEGEEEYTEAPLLRKTCLNHGLTIHLAYDQVQPYPLFKPHVQLKCQDSVLFNSGNIFHMFTIKSVRPNEESPFKGELLNPPRRATKSQARKRHLSCDFWFKNDPARHTSVSLATIIKNCSSTVASKKELNRFIKSTKLSPAEEHDYILDINRQKLLLSSLSTNSASLNFPTRRMSASSCDSELSTGDFQPQLVPEYTYSASTSLTWSWSKESNNSNDPADSSSMHETAFVEPARMLPPPERKFFKGLRKSYRKALPQPAAHAAQEADISLLEEPSSEKAFDVFDVTTDEIPIDRSFSSFRKRKLADKKYEFSDEIDDDCVSATNNNTMILRRRSTRRRPVTNSINICVDENSMSSVCGSNQSSPRCDTTNNLQHGGSSPRLAPTVTSPALSPSYNSPAEILRPITNTPISYVANSSQIDVSKIKEEESHENEIKEPVCINTAESKRSTRSTAKEATNANSKPTFSSYVNCIAKVLRCYAEADEADDNLSVRTDTDDEYKQTLPFPIALALSVHGREHQQLAMLSNSKAKFCPTRRIEILQRSLDIEILCNEVSTMICLANGKYFCCCFDYDVAIVDVCPNNGVVTSLAVVLFSATNIKRYQQERYSAYNYDMPSIPGIPDPRKKYEAIFSFSWNPVDEFARVLYMGNLVELQSIPEQWNPTKYIIPHISSLLNTNEPVQMTLRNDMAVTDSQSLYQLRDFDGIITLYRHETLYERLRRQKIEAKHRHRRMRELAPASNSGSEREEDVSSLNLSIISDSSLDSNEQSLGWTSDIGN